MGGSFRAVLINVSLGLVLLCNTGSRSDVDLGDVCFGPVFCFTLDSFGSLFE